MSHIYRFPIYILSVMLLCVVMMSCSDHEEVRKPTDILGIWSPAQDVYLEFLNDNVVHRLQIETQDGETIGDWTKDVYYYEPGYNLVIYLTSDHEAMVYEIVELTSTHFTWCWVYNIDVTGAEEISKVLGDIINKAQEGFHLDPALYQTFNHVSEDKFYSILEELNILYPW